MNGVRPLLALGTAAITAAALVSAAPGGSVSTAHASVRARSLSANRRAARADAQALIARVRLPAGAARVGSEPARDHGYLKPMGSLEGDQAHAVAHAWWMVAGTPAATLAYVEAHPPAGGRAFAGASEGNTRTHTSAQAEDFQWPGVRGVLGDRELDVIVTALPGGRTGVLAESQSDWIVPRPAGERIPASTRVIQISSDPPGGRPATLLTVTGGSRVRRIVALLNALPIAQPTVIMCPLLTDPVQITMTFRARPGGRALAVLSYRDYRPWNGPAGGCKPVSLTIGGRRWPALDGGRFLQRIERLLHTSLV